MSSILLKPAGDIAKMRRGGDILAKTLEAVRQAVRPGVTTAELSQLADKQIRGLGGKPAFLGYQGFPAPICISVNDELVHGIPGPRQLQDGDIVGVDVGVEYQGLIVDGAATFGVGQISSEAQRLLAATQQALQAGVTAAWAGNQVGDISAAIETRLEQDGLGVIRELSGHGVGYSLHEEPAVPNFGQVHQGPQLKASMTLAIEPMAALGSPKVRVLGDGWTFVSVDGSLTAQFEHTVLITDGAAEILTQSS